MIFLQFKTYDFDKFILHLNDYNRYKYCVEIFSKYSTTFLLAGVTPSSILLFYFTIKLIFSHLLLFVLYIVSQIVQLYTCIQWHKQKCKASSFNLAHCVSVAYMCCIVCWCTDCTRELFY